MWEGRKHLSRRCQLLRIRLPASIFDRPCSPSAVLPDSVLRNFHIDFLGNPSKHLVRYLFLFQCLLEKGRSLAVAEQTGIPPRAAVSSHFAMFNRWAAAIRATSFTLSSMSSSITALPSFTILPWPYTLGPFAFPPIPSKMVSMRRACSLVSRDAPRKLHAVSAEEDAFAIFGKALINCCSASYKSLELFQIEII